MSLESALVTLSFLATLSCAVYCFLRRDWAQGGVFFGLALSWTKLLALMVLGVICMTVSGFLFVKRQSQLPPKSW
jgi:hypothetical protein